MQNLSLSIMLALSASTIYAQADEKVEVTGSRIPYESAGLIAFSSGGGPGEPDHGCAEPTCGGMVNPVEPGSGIGHTTIANKNQRNKQAKQKVQQKGPSVKQPIKNTKQPQSQEGILATLERWFSNATMTSVVTEETETPSGKILKNSSCRHIDLAAEKGPNPCIEKKIDVEKVLKSNGDLTNQAQLSFVIYDECYYTKQCGPEYITFIAETQQELNILLNDALGENYF
ncbi:MAG TPA: hypothetical protein VE954_21885 [Oligoflexus sp.]|uniref:hypothetical protein n=1 Tax=Oligoflexus sp. TaxID=1971216 RepID=UPI002D607A28|nr:hypothetical protein [Oligoflexus sp.]HYX35757.1 hypothetical protein [Oligoflexus sp.]